jgi:hypothetical protein
MAEGERCASYIERDGKSTRPCPTGVMVRVTVVRHFVSE